MDPQKGRGTAVILLGACGLRAAAKLFAGQASMRALFWPENWAEPAYSPEFLRAGRFAGSARVALTCMGECSCACVNDYVYTVLLKNDVPAVDLAGFLDPSQPLVLL